MSPIGIIATGTVVFMEAAGARVTALFLRPHAIRRDEGQGFAAVGACLCIVGWSAVLWAAPGTNNPSRVYAMAAVWSAPTLLAVSVYPWFRTRARRGFDVIDTPHDGSDKS